MATKPLMNCLDVNYIKSIFPDTNNQVVQSLQGNSFYASDAQFQMYRSAMFGDLEFLQKGNLFCRERGLIENGDGEKILGNALSMLTWNDSHWLQNKFDNKNQYIEPQEGEYIAWWHKMHIVFYLLYESGIKVNWNNAMAYDIGERNYCYPERIFAFPILFHIFQKDYFLFAIKHHKKNEMINLIELFLRNGADINVNYNSNTILDCFAYAYRHYIEEDCPHNIDHYHSASYDERKIIHEWIKNKKESLKTDYVFIQLEEMRNYLSSSKGAKFYNDINK